MKWLLVLGLVSGYAYFLTYTTNLVVRQTTQLNQTYQYVANNAEQIAAGR